LIFSLFQNQKSRAFDAVSAESLQSLRECLKLHHEASSSLKLHTTGSLMPKPAESPLVYQESLPQVRREFRLYRDRVEVDARWTIGRSHCTTVKLADLTTQVARFTVRNKWFKKAILIGSLAVSVAIVFSRDKYSLPMHRAAGFGWPVAGICVVVAILSARKRQFAHFPRKDGRPGLDICRTDPERFEDFLREVQKRIGKA
jgi:hypothetical protein